MITIQGTLLLRFLASLLITNSHLDRLYPIAALGTGGSLGNAIFFAVSGYGLTVSVRHKLPFFAWYLRRILRVYPSVLVVTLAALLVGAHSVVVRVGDLLREFVFPTSFWFVGAIMVFYALAYPIIRSRSLKLVITSTVCACVVYSVWYGFFLDTRTWVVEGPGYFKWVFYWLVMMLGIALALKPEWLAIRPAVSRTLAALSLTSYVTVKVIVAGLLPHLQFAVQLLTLLVVYALFAVMSDETLVSGVVNGRAGAFVTFIGGLTLEIYLVQYSVYSNPMVLVLPFPINAIAFAIGTLALAWAAQWMGRRLVSIVGLRDR